MGGSGSLQFLVILSLADNRKCVMTFLIGLGYCFMSRDSSAGEGLMGIVICVMSESKQNIESQSFVSLGQFQKMCNISPLCPHCLQHELSRFMLYLAILSGVRYQWCVNLIANSQRVEQQVVCGFAGLFPFIHCVGLSQVRLPSKKWDGFGKDTFVL